MTIEEVASWVFALAFLWWACNRSDAKIRRKEKKKDDAPDLFI